ncbi:hypothetical protein AFLA_007945 [Aspergillus flavus NRRL3357]|nr:hypothetical protein AFLA_007945 [Aspergillus flavus NRRL3357]
MPSVGSLSTKYSPRDNEMGRQRSRYELSRSWERLQWHNARLTYAARAERGRRKRADLITFINYPNWVMIPECYPNINLQPDLLLVISSVCYLT